MNNDYVNPDPILYMDTTGRIDIKDNWICDCKDKQAFKDRISDGSLLEVIKEHGQYLSNLDDLYMHVHTGSVDGKENWICDCEGEEGFNDCISDGSLVPVKLKNGEYIDPEDDNEDDN